MSECDLIVDSDFGKGDKYDEKAREPRYVFDSDHWGIVQCKSFLDASNTPRMHRAFEFGQVKSWGKYCLLHRK